MPDPDAGRTPAECAQDFGHAARVFQRRGFAECWRKLRYPTRAQAEGMAARRRMQGDTGLEVYRCSFTAGGVHWHVGHARRGGG
jgi:hypothetical protein